MIEAYLRNLYAFGPDVQRYGVAAERNRGPRIAGNLDVRQDREKAAEDAKFYVSKDGKYLIRGEVSDLAKDPLAAKPGIDRYEGCAIV